MEQVIPLGVALRRSGSANVVVPLPTLPANSITLPSAHSVPRPGRTLPLRARSSRASRQPVRVSQSRNGVITTNTEPGGRQATERMRRIVVG